METKKKRVTERQRAAIHFCEEWLQIKFEGNIHNFHEISDFLAEYLDEAKNIAEEIACEYEAYQWERMMN